ncbi:MAG: peptidoglycan-binding domain-containing protein, partial [Alphaproteobacteria bacterium]
RRTYVAPVSTQLVADIQYSLTNLGYNPGPVDGVMGRGTRAAVRAYQADAGLLVTGRVSRPLLTHMQGQGG